MIPDRNRRDVNAQDFEAKDMLVLFILKASAQWSKIQFLAHFKVFGSHICLHYLIVDTGLPTAHIFDSHGFQ
jgi:hypothetical protein